jgi:hypothetical protein
MRRPGVRLEDQLELMFAAGSRLDQQALKHGEKTTLDATDIARVRLTAHGSRICLRRKLSHIESIASYSLVSNLPNLDKSSTAI